MIRYLNRGEAPLTPEEWQAIDGAVAQEARTSLAGRRVAATIGPLGAGVQSVHRHPFPGVQPAEIGLSMTTDPSPIRPEPETLSIPVLYKDFWIDWRDIETTRKFGVPLDISPVAAATNFVAQREDDMLFKGHRPLGYTGLATAPGRTVLARRDWAQMGNAFADAAAAMQRLVEAGFYGPFAMVVSPAQYAAMARVYENTGVLEVEQVRKIMTAGVFYTPVLADDVALVAAVGPQNFDVVITQDIAVAYLTQQDLNHPFRVFESLVLRIHRPESICTLEARG